MYHYKHLSIIFLSVFIFSACNNKKDLQTEIQKLETTVFKEELPNFDVKNADQLLSKYETYIANYPTDSASISYTFKAAQLYATNNQPEKAIEKYEQFITTYPQHQKAAECLFYQAFIYENALKDLNKAKEKYQTFIAKYPHHPLTKDAEMSIKYLGKSDEELIKEFEKNLKQDSLSKSNQPNI